PRPVTDGGRTTSPSWQPPATTQTQQTASQQATTQQTVPPVTTTPPTPTTQTSTQGGGWTPPTTNQTPTSTTSAVTPATPEPRLPGTEVRSPTDQVTVRHRPSVRTVNPPVPTETYETGITCPNCAAGNKVGRNFCRRC